MSISSQHKIWQSLTYFYLYCEQRTTKNVARHPVMQTLSQNPLKLPMTTNDALRRIQGENKAGCGPLSFGWMSPKSVRCLSHKEFKWPQILASLYTQKSTKIINRNISSLWLAIIFSQNIHLTTHIYQPKIYINWIFLYLFGKVPQSCLQGCPQ